MDIESNVFLKVFSIKELADRILSKYNNKHFYEVNLFDACTHKWYDIIIHRMNDFFTMESNRWIPTNSSMSEIYRLVHHRNFEGLTFLDKCNVLFPKDVMNSVHGNDKIPIVEYLWSIGYKPTIKMLENACKEGDLEFMKWVHDHDVSPTCYCLDLAASHGNVEIVQYLTNYGVVSKNAMNLALLNKYEKVYLYLHNTNLYKTNLSTLKNILKDNENNSHLKTIRFLYEHLNTVFSNMTIALFLKIIHHYQIDYDDL